MAKIGKYIILWQAGFFAFAILFLPATVRAGIEIKTDAEVYLNEDFSLSVLFKEDQISANGVSGEIWFQPKTFALKSISDGGSAVSLWLQQPKEQGEKVVFSGITPGGIVTGKLFNLKFLAKQEGDFFISLKNSQVFLNDGSGKKNQIMEQTVKIHVLPPVNAIKSVKEPSLEEADTVPPENFSVNISRNENIFQNQWFAAFSATDGQSGVYKYEALESLSHKMPDGGFVEVKSPYVLKDQSRKSYIFFKVYDRAGNFSLQTVSPQTVEKNELFGIIKYVIIFVVILVILSVWRKKQNAKEKQ